MRWGGHDATYASRRHPQGPNTAGMHYPASASHRDAMSSAQDYTRKRLRGYRLSGKETRRNVNLQPKLARLSRSAFGVVERVQRREDNGRQCKNQNLVPASTACGNRCLCYAHTSMLQGCKPNMRIITSMMGVDAVNVSFQLHMLRTRSVISIPVIDNTTTIARRLSTFHSE